MADQQPLSSRGTWAVVGRIRAAISAGRYGTGQFLPPVRELSARHRVSAETVRRGLKVLEGEGLLASEPRQGFRVRGRSAEAIGGRPLAYVTDHHRDLLDAQPANWALIEAFQQAAAVRGSAVLATPCGGQSRPAVLDRLRAGHASGIVLDTLDPELVETIRQVGLPVVMVNSWWEDTEFDVVLQDNYRGGFLAAKHLVDSGCKTVAWVGPVGQFCHSRERFAGAVAALAAAGRRPAEPLSVDYQNEVLLTNVLDMLGRSDRPDGFLAFTSAGTVAVREAAIQQGLKLGTDVRMVGWIVEEFYSREHVPIFNGGPVPPAVVWKASSMAERALALLAERRAGRAGEPVRVCVPTRLKFAEK